MTPLWTLVNPFSTYSAQQIHQMHVTDSNALNLAKKTAKLRERAILERNDLEQLPQEGQRMIKRLKEIRVKKSANRANRERILKQIEWWKTVEVVASVAGVILGVLIPVAGNFFPDAIDADAMHKHILPGGILLSTAVYNHYNADRDMTETKSEYHEKKHGLDNERAAILVELEPMLKQLDAAGKGVPQSQQPAMKLPLSLLNSPFARKTS